MSCRHNGSACTLASMRKSNAPGQAPLLIVKVSGAYATVAPRCLPLSSSRVRTNVREERGDSEAGSSLNLIKGRGSGLFGRGPAAGPLEGRLDAN